MQPKLKKIYITKNKYCLDYSQANLAKNIIATTLDDSLRLSMQKRELDSGSSHCFHVIQKHGHLEAIQPQSYTIYKPNYKK